MTGQCGPRRITLRDGRELTVRMVAEVDAAEILQAFERLSDQSRYYRFMRHVKHLDEDALQRGVHPRPGRDCTLVATVPAADGIDIVGAAQYVQAGEPDAGACEFAITVAEDWRGCGLASELLASLVRLARSDGYETMVGFVIAENTAMLALARALEFETEAVPGDATVLRVQRMLKGRPPDNA